MGNIVPKTKETWSAEKYGPDRELIKIGLAINPIARESGIVKESLFIFLISSSRQIIPICPAMIIPAPKPQKVLPKTKKLWLLKNKLAKLPKNMKNKPGRRILFMLSLLLGIPEKIRKTKKVTKKEIAKLSFIHLSLASIDLAEKAEIATI
jgi:hypothetical protein